MLQPLDVLPQLPRVADADREAAAALEGHLDRLPPDRRLDHLLHLAHREPVARQRPAVGDDVQVERSGVAAVGLRVNDQVGLNLTAGVPVYLRTNATQLAEEALLAARLVYHSGPTFGKAQP